MTDMNRETTWTLPAHSRVVRESERVVRICLPDAAATHDVYAKLAAMEPEPDEVELLFRKLMGIWDGRGDWSERNLEDDDIDFIMALREEIARAKNIGWNEALDELSISAREETSPAVSRFVDGAAVRLKRPVV